MGRTTLSITHRVLSAARLASTVVVLDKGRVVGLVVMLRGEDSIAGGNRKAQ